MDHATGHSLVEHILGVHGVSWTPETGFEILFPSAIQPGLGIPLNTHSFSRLPGYVKPLASRLSLEDLKFLEKKDALTIPPNDLRNRLIGSYVEFGYPFMPVVDLSEIHAIIHGQSKTGRLSLLLLQSIMFAGAATIDSRYLIAAGFSTKRDARRHFFNRARLLFDLDAETDTVQLVQSLILMTHWYEGPDYQKDSHHWMGVAASMLPLIEPRKDSTRSHPEQRLGQSLWKRIWWSAYMRDRLISLGMRRPVCINRDDYDVPALETDDFEIKPFPHPEHCASDDFCLPLDTDKHYQLAKICIALGSLCQCIGDILSTHYSIRRCGNYEQASRADIQTRTLMVLQPKTSRILSNETKACEDDLGNWKQRFAEDTYFAVPTRQNHGRGDHSIICHKSLLYMLYLSAVSALHRPLLGLASHAQHEHNAVDLAKSQDIVRNSAAEVLATITILDELDLIPFLPGVTLTAVIPALIVQLTGDQVQREGNAGTRSSQTLNRCLNVCQQLRDTHVAADFAIGILDAAVFNATLRNRSHWDGT